MIAIEVHLDAEASATMARDVRRGLLTIPKELSPKYFYDERGSQLFEQITELDEYYPTRAEREILGRALGRDRRRGRRARPTLVELGSGSAAKTRHLLERDARGRLPARPTSRSTSPRRSPTRPPSCWSSEYPGLDVRGLVCDFEHHLERIPDTGERAPDRLPRRHDRQPLPLPAPLLHVPDRGADVPRRPLPARHRPDQGPGAARGRLRRRRGRHRRVQQERARGAQPRAGRRLRPRRLRARRPLRRGRGADGHPPALAGRPERAARGHRPRRSSSPPARSCGPRSRPSSPASGSTGSTPTPASSSAAGSPTRPATTRSASPAPA